jgi:hypothetical protein
MAVYTKTYNGVPGAASIVDPELAFVTILQVTREGKVQQQIDTTPSDTLPKFYYNAPPGRILFSGLLRFTTGMGSDPYGARTTPEKITVTYKV